MTTQLRGPDRWRLAAPARAVAYAVGAILIGAGIVILGPAFARHLDGFDAWIGQQGAASLAIFVFVYAILNSVLVPDLLLGVAAGAVFGFGRGVAAVALGSLVANSFQFLLARRLLTGLIRGFLERRPILAATMEAVRRQPIRLQMLIRLTPLNRAITSYVLGATGVGFTSFTAASVALVPSLCLEVYVGGAGTHLAQMAGPGGHAVQGHDVALVGGLVAATVTMIVVARTARRILAETASPATRRG